MKKDICPPHSLDAEKSVLGSILIDPDNLISVCQILSPKDFYHNAHRIIFEAMIETSKANKPVDLITLANFLEEENKLVSVGGISYVSSLTLDVYTGIHAVDHAMIVKDKSFKRQLVDVGESIKTLGHNEPSEGLVEKAAKALFTVLIKIKNSVENEPKEASQILDSIKSMWDKIKGKKIIGLSTETFLDNYIYGYQRKHYWIIGGYTNYGKTTYACYLASKLVKKNSTVAFFSVEMSKEQTLEKIIVQYCQSDGYDIRNNQDKFKQQLDDVANSKILVYDDKFTVEDITLELMQLRINGNLPEVVFIDFIQNIFSEGLTMYEKLTNITLKLQKMAKELNVCVIALSQISNDGMSKASEVIPFKGSGELASSADLGIQLFRQKREEKDEDEFVPLEIHIKKNRHGKSGAKNKLRLNTRSGVLDDLPIPQKIKQDKPLDHTDQAWWENI